MKLTATAPSMPSILWGKITRFVFILFHDFISFDVCCCLYRPSPCSVYEMCVIGRRTQPNARNVRTDCKYSLKFEVVWSSVFDVRFPDSVFPVIRRKMHLSGFSSFLPREFLRFRFFSLELWKPFSNFKSIFNFHIFSYQILVLNVFDGIGMINTR